MARVLIIDDEPHVLGFLVDLLEGQGHQVTGLTSAQRALEVVDAAAVPFDLILLDVVMAPRELDGIGFLFRLRKKAEAAHLPVLIVSGLAGVINRDAARHLGVRGLHPKPIDTEKLLAQVASVLGEGARTGEPPSFGDAARSEAAARSDHLTL
jgi:DNA-binding response OmpR family regulator